MIKINVERNGQYSSISVETFRTTVDLGLNDDAEAEQIFKALIDGAYEIAMIHNQDKYKHALAEFLESTFD